MAYYLVGLNKINYYLLRVESVVSIRGTFLIRGQVQVPEILWVRFVFKWRHLWKMLKCARAIEGGKNSQREKKTIQEEEEREERESAKAD